MGKKKLSAFLILAACLVFVLHLYLRLSTYSGTVWCCDTYYYYDVLEHGHLQIIPLTGSLVFLPLFFFKMLSDTIWSINIVGSLLSAAFFLVFYAFLCRNGIGKKLAFLTATVATFSFLWLWISEGLLKNELGFVIAILFFQSFIDSVRNRKVGISTIALGLALLLAHASTSYWVLLSLVGFFAIREIKEKHWGYLCLIFITYITMLALSSAVFGESQFRDVTPFLEMFRDLSLALLVISPALVGLELLRQSTSATKKMAVLTQKMAVLTLLAAACISALVAILCSIGYCSLNSIVDYILKWGDFSGWATWLLFLASAPICYYGLTALKKKQNEAQDALLAFMISAAALTFANVFGQRFIFDSFWVVLFLLATGIQKLLSAKVSMANPKKLWLHFFMVSIVAVYLFLFSYSSLKNMTVEGPRLSRADIAEISIMLDRLNPKYVVSDIYDLRFTGRNISSCKPMNPNRNETLIVGLGANDKNNLSCSSKFVFKMCG